MVNLVAAVVACVCISITVAIPQLWAEDGSVDLLDEGKPQNPPRFFPAELGLEDRESKEDEEENWGAPVEGVIVGSSPNGPPDSGEIGLESEERDGTVGTQDDEQFLSDTYEFR